MRLTIEGGYHRAVGDIDALDELERANALVDDYLRFVKANDIRKQVIDEIELPVPKLRLVKAFCVAIACERRPDTRALLIRAGLALAQYQPGIGPRIFIGAHHHFRSERSRFAARRLENILFMVAEARVRLGDLFLAVVKRSLH
jgi:hypothetical protein